jgi:hypothetical protein
MKAVHLCAQCRKRWKAILAAYGVGPSAMRHKDSLAREWALVIKDALNGLCWCSGGECKGTSVPPAVFPEELLRAAKKKSSRLH